MRGKQTKRRAGATTPGTLAVALVAHVQRRLEQERMHLSRVLHHDVSGTLAAARMDLSRLMVREADEDLQAQIRRVDQLLDQVIRDARRELQRLHPALLDHFGLPLALRHLVDEACRETGVRYDLKLDAALEDVAPEVLIATFRLVETLLSDCRGITEFELRLGSRRDGHVLEIARTGAVDPEASAAPDPFDVEAIRAWLGALGVSWKESAAGGRRVIELRLPRTAGRSEAPGG